MMMRGLYKMEEKIIRVYNKSGTGGVRINLSMAVREGMLDRAYHDIGLFSKLNVLSVRDVRLARAEIYHEKFGFYPDAEDCDLAA